MWTTTEAPGCGSRKCPPGGLQPALDLVTTTHKASSPHGTPHVLSTIYLQSANPGGAWRQPTTRSPLPLQPTPALRLLALAKWSFCNALYTTLSFTHRGLAPSWPLKSTSAPPPPPGEVFPAHCSSQASQSWSGATAGPALGVYAPSLVGWAETPTACLRGRTCSCATQ